ncbi:MAG: hypothetical protein E7559_04000 [Ruminococcaceae bacterium]|nr:hypothetical protein [Oscillospiraceae bacterium]
MTVIQITTLLKDKLYQQGFEYGFYLNGQKYRPDMSGGFDRRYYHLSRTIYIVQSPADTEREKIGTCIDTVVLMKSLLNGIAVPCKIWLLHEKARNKMHTILTFSAEGKTVYLELTPQSNKPWYGKEILYGSESELIAEYQGKGCDVIDVTEEIVIGEPPRFLLSRLQEK